MVLTNGVKKQTNLRADVRRDWTWADRYLKDIARILKANAGRLIAIKVAPMTNDLEQATDLVISIEGGDVAVRVRRDCKYRDLTIRAWRRSGTKTEIDKISSGFGRWYLYAWTDSKGKIVDWILVDLDKFRNSGLLEDNRRIIPNPDKRTGFKVYTINELSKNNCLIARA